MKIYIAGKVTGEDVKPCKEKFLRAEYVLRKKGYEVVNPTKLLSPTANWNEAMRVCIKELAGCDEIYMLEDWRESRGASIEHLVAKAIGLKITYQNRADEYVERLSRDVG